MKVRKCPHCKSKKGFEVTIMLGGYQTYICDFNGKVIDTERVGADSVDKHVSCLDCKKTIRTENVNFKN